MQQYSTCKRVLIERWKQKQKLPRCDCSQVSVDTEDRLSGSARPRLVTVPVIDAVHYFVGIIDQEDASKIRQTTRLTDLVI